jgi:hypothetical protein
MFKILNNINEPPPLWARRTDDYHLLMAGQFQISIAGYGFGSQEGDKIGIVQSS